VPNFANNLEILELGFFPLSFKKSAFSLQTLEGLIKIAAALFRFFQSVVDFLVLCLYV